VLPKSHRLPLKSEFGRIKKEGRIINGPFFGLLVAKNHQNQSRFGLVVSTNVDKRSVVRHRIKRLLSEAVRVILNRIEPGWDFVFLGKKGAEGKSFKEVQKAVEFCLKQAGLLI